MPRERQGFDAVQLGDGAILAVGSDWGCQPGPAVPSSTKILDPMTRAWTDGPLLEYARVQPSAVRLDDGREGFSGAWVALRSTELYDPATDTWTPAGDLSEPRHSGRLVALDDGSALVLGGTTEYNVHGDAPFCPVPLTTVERFWP
jgi:hypothetical protein